MSVPLPLKSNCGYLSSRDGKYTTWRGLFGKLFGFNLKEPTDELHPFSKEEKLVETKQLTWLPYLVVYVKLNKFETVGSSITKDLL